MSNIAFQDDYGSLSTKALRKIIPHLKAGLEYSTAAAEAGYHHSRGSEKDQKKLDDRLQLVPKNSLRNPIVEKILNQVVNVVNAVITVYGKPDEIRVELARELKKSATERENLMRAIGAATRVHDEIRKELRDAYPFNTGVRITKNDIIKYKLWQELATLGYKDLYTGEHIKKEELFSKKYDIEHIIPKAKLFDDSFSNKTLSPRQFNLDKGSKTGIDAIEEKYGKESNGYNAYLSRVQQLFDAKVISKSKYLKLRMTESDIPDGFIERDLRNSQYIAKKSIEILQKVCREVQATSGSVTDRLRQDWQLVNVLQDLNWKKYTKLGLTHHEINKDGAQIPKIENWSKRNDHRHHVMDAITVAFTKKAFIQYLNNLNARSDKAGSILGIEQKHTTVVTDKSGGKKRLIKPPMPVGDFRAEAKRHLESTLVSFKAKNKVVTKNINRTKKKKGWNEQLELTPRGKLHKETTYGKRLRYATKLEKIGTKFDDAKIAMVANQNYRHALQKRLDEYNQDPQKAFGGKNSPSQSPIYVNADQTMQVPDKVKLVWLEEYFTIRKEVSPELKVDKVVDKEVQRILQKRLDDFGGRPKAAFSNLEENSIWLKEPIPMEKWKNKEHPLPDELGIKLKRVTITGVSNALPIHHKNDLYGQQMTDEDGKPIPSSYVSTGNNHHVAVYRDIDGRLQENVVSFFEAVERARQNVPIVDKQYKADEGWQFVFSMKQNEMFVFPNAESGFNPAEIDLMDEENYTLISPNLFRVQKIASKDYFFRHHLETTVENDSATKNICWKREGLSGIGKIAKVRLNQLGEIVHVGEY